MPVGNFPVQLSAPALLPDPAAPALAANHQEGGKVRGMVVKAHKTAGLKQFDQFAANPRRAVGKGAGR